MNGLSVTGLSLARGGRTLFAGLDFTLAAGEAATLTGANGAGKTSVLRAIAGLLRPVAGEIAFAGMEGDAAREAALHLLGHHDGLKPGRCAGEELAFWAQWLGADAGGVTRATAAFDLAPLLDLEVRRLSAGQRRRVALARLVAAPRPLWLLDEPLAPLDAGNRARFGEVLREHLAGGGMVLAAVHDPLPVPARAISVGAEA